MYVCVYIYIYIDIYIYIYIIAIEFFQDSLGNISKGRKSHL